MTLLVFATTLRITLWFHLKHSCEESMESFKFYVEVAWRGTFSGNIHVFMNCKIHSQLFHASSEYAIVNLRNYSIVHKRWIWLVKYSLSAVPESTLQLEESSNLRKLWCSSAWELFHILCGFSSTPQRFSPILWFHSIAPQ